MESWNDIDSMSLDKIKDKIEHHKKLVTFWESIYLAKTEWADCKND